MRVCRSFGVLVITASAMACSYDASRQSATITSPDPVAGAPASGNATSGTTALQLSATMQFGLEDVGSGHPPTHPSFHANDTIVPGTVVIDEGGTVTFNAVSIHQLGIFGPGKQPKDVDVTNLVPHPCNVNFPPLINDSDLIPINGSNPSGCGPRTYTHTFADPGEYLVICRVLPHFQINMYGWVRVRPRA